LSASFSSTRTDPELEDDGAIRCAARSTRALADVDAVSGWLTALRMLVPTRVAQPSAGSVSSGTAAHKQSAPVVWLAYSGVESTHSVSRACRAKCDAL